MIPPLYIISACTISPQHTYDEAQFLAPVTTCDNGKMYVIDPDYTKYISPVAIRRMSRMLKRGITAGMKSLEDAKVATPDAIIIGTARGSVTDMENFMKDMIKMEEQALNPTSFIQSTYNSVNGWLAMMTKCTAYNQTYVHRGYSLELSLLDAQLLLAESDDEKYILTGGFDEMTEEYFTIRIKIGYYKDQFPPSLELLSHYDTPGTIGGEGAHFFTVSNRPGNSVCAIYNIAMLQHPTTEELLASVENIFSENSLTKEDIDILVCGMNGDSRNSHLIDPLLQSCTANTTVVSFKQLCGEYDTASGFGLWLANYICKHKQIPPSMVYRQGTSTAIKNILFCNVTVAGNMSVLLLQATA